MVNLYGVLISCLIVSLLVTIFLYIKDHKEKGIFLSISIFIGSVTILAILFSNPISKESNSINVSVQSNVNYDTDNTNENENINLEEEDMSLSEKIDKLSK